MSPFSLRRAGQALALLLASSATLAASPSDDDLRWLDRQTVTVVQRLIDGRAGEALALARDLSERHPDFRLGQLLRAELETVQALDPLKALGSDAWSDELLDLLLEARTRLEHADPVDATRDTSRNDEPLLPRALVQIGPDISDIVFVDLSASELLHYRVRDRQPQLVRRHYVSSGSAGFGKWAEGDLRTPLGVYRIRGFRPGHTLPDLYGAGALTLNYPNDLDRALGRTGSGIWLHGVPSAHASRAPWSSEGCVTMSNAYLDTLAEELDRPATVVVLSDGIDWVSPASALVRAERYGALPGDTVIEVPRRGATRHLALLRGGEDGADWRYLPIDAGLVDPGTVALR